MRSAQAAVKEEGEEGEEEGSGAALGSGRASPSCNAPHDRGEGGQHLQSVGRRQGRGQLSGQKQAPTQRQQQQQMGEVGRDQDLVAQQAAAQGLIEGVEQEAGHGQQQQRQMVKHEGGHSQQLQQQQGKGRALLDPPTIRLHEALCPGVKCFSGAILHTYVCRACGHETRVREQFSHLSLQIPHSSAGTRMCVCERVCVCVCVSVCLRARACVREQFSHVSLLVPHSSTCTCLFKCAICLCVMVCVMRASA